MTNILRATHEGDLRIGEIAIPCSVLEGGIRVLSRRGVNAALAGSTGGSYGGNVGGRNLPRILASAAVKPHISPELLTGIENAYEFHPLHGGRTAIGFEATLLPLMCEAILDADKSKSLKNQDAVAIAEILIRGFARVGIIALVDEATGYQEVRDRRALEAILDAYLRKELAAWAKRFPDEFYKEMFRLRGWKWSLMTVQRPGVVGRYTNDLIYERLAPNILQELEKRNPKDEKGNRKGRHHQLLTDEVGHPALAQHLHAVIGLMRGSTSWESFYRFLQRAYPKKNEQLPLLLDD